MDSTPTTATTTAASTANTTTITATTTTSSTSDTTATDAVDPTPTIDSTDNTDAFDQDDNQDDNEEENHKQESNNSHDSDSDVSGSDTPTSATATTTTTTTTANPIDNPSTPGLPPPPPVIITIPPRISLSLHLRKGIPKTHLRTVKTLPSTLSFDFIRSPTQYPSSRQLYSALCTEIQTRIQESLEATIHHSSATVKNRLFWPKSGYASFPFGRPKITTRQQNYVQLNEWNCRELLEKWWVGERKRLGTEEGCEVHLFIYLQDLKSFEALEDEEKMNGGVVNGSHGGHGNAGSVSPSPSSTGPASPSRTSVGPTPAALMAINGHGHGSRRGGERGGREEGGERLRPSSSSMMPSHHYHHHQQQQSTSARKRRRYHEMEHDEEEDLDARFSLAVQQVEAEAKRVSLAAGQGSSSTSSSSSSFTRSTSLSVAPPTPVRRGPGRPRGSLNGTIGSHNPAQLETRRGADRREPSEGGAIYQNGGNDHGHENGHASSRYNDHHHHHHHQYHHHSDHDPRANPLESQPIWEEDHDQEMEDVAVTRALAALEARVQAAETRAEIAEARAVAAEARATAVLSARRSAAAAGTLSTPAVSATIHPTDDEQGVRMAITFNMGDFRRAFGLDT